MRARPPSDLCYFERLSAEDISVASMPSVGRQVVLSRDKNKITRISMSVVVARNVGKHGSPSLAHVFSILLIGKEYLRDDCDKNEIFL